MKFLTSVAFPPPSHQASSMASRKQTQAANWEPSYPQKTSTRYGIPAIYLNLEVGLSFEDNRTHSASMKYTSKKMEERLHEQRIRQQYEEGRYSIQHPAFLMPANGHFPNRPTRQQQQQRQRRLGVNTREQHERGTSAPPTTLDRNQPLSPVSPLTATMPDTPGRTLTIPMERANQPLPPTPSQFRLGEADMPWSVDPYFIPEPETPTQEYAPMKEEETPRLEDAKRAAGDLEALHLAMMTVDSLDDGSWEQPTWGSVRNRWGGGPNSIGWAVSSEDEPLPSPPQLQLPPYSSVRWENPFASSPSRPRTAGA